MTPVQDPACDLAAASAETELSSEEIEKMIRELRKDPQRVKTLFPGISKASPTDLPKSERPLVLIPMADAWADS